MICTMEGSGPTKEELGIDRQIRKELGLPKRGVINKIGDWIKGVPPDNQEKGRLKRLLDKHSGNNMQTSVPAEPPASPSQPQK